MARVDEGRIAETVEGNIMSRAGNLDAEWPRQQGSATGDWLVFITSACVVMD
mgnify:CR=1 FL=1